MARQKTVNDKIIKILKDYPEQRFTAREIAIRLIEIYPEAMRQKRDASTQDFSDDNKFVNQLVAEIGSKRPELEKRHPIQFKYTSDRP
ncbi:MAG: HrgA protein, partial [Pseudomonadota bacterium]